MERVSPYFCEFTTVDTRSPSVKYLQDFSTGEMDDKGFKKALRQIEGRFDSGVLVTETIVSHYGYINGNWRYYNPAFGKYNAATLIKPAPRPVLINHDRHSTPLGRVLVATYEDIAGLSIRQKEDLKTRTGYVKAFAYITGRDNIEKVMDERYLTVSIGGKSPVVRCSVCQVNLVEQRCEHELGEKYDTEDSKGVLCYLIYDAQGYIEYSYVNAPADVEARTQRFQLSAPEDCQHSDYAELVRATMRSPATKPLESYDEDGYAAYMTDAKHREYFSFTDAQMHSSEDILGKLVPSAPEEKGDVGDSATPANKPKTTTSNKEDNAVNINEATLDDLLKLGIYKDHIATLRKTDTESISGLTQTVKDRDASIVTLNKTIEDHAPIVAKKDEDITKLNEQLDEYHATEKDGKVGQLVDLMIKLEKPSVKNVLDEKDADKKQSLRSEHVTKMAERSEESIGDSLVDLQAELKARKDQAGDGSPTDTVDDDVTHNDNRGGSGNKHRSGLSAIINKNK